MANVNEQSTWERGIYQIEQTDVVRGGSPESGGVANIQAQQLANRTVWLRDNLQQNKRIVLKDVSENIILKKEDLVNTYVVLNVQTETLCNAYFNTTGLPDGSLISITIIGPGINRINIASDIEKAGTPSNEYRYDFWLYSGESADFVFSGGILYLVGGNSDLKNVGNVFRNYGNPHLGVIADGSLLQRSIYPRLWQFVNKYARVVSDSTWLINREAYRGHFSSGDGSTNFRLPDLRGLFIRNSDRNRGLDIDRYTIDSKDGTYQNDSFKKHSHEQGSESLYNKYGGGIYVGNRTYNSGLINSYTNQRTSDVGGIETRPKNIALTAYIKF